MWGIIILMSKVEREEIEFNGINFYRYPKAKQKNRRRYFEPRLKYRKLGIESLHREIYKKFYGEIPEGFHVHHKNHDWNNNAPNNLICLSVKEHNKEHEQELKIYNDSEIHRFHLTKIREKAAEWHKSEEGKEWHSNQAKQSYKNLEEKTKECLFCHKNYNSKTIQKSDGYCSKLCRNRSIEKTKKYWQEEICVVCGNKFLNYKYQTKHRKLSCSRKCSWILRKKS